MPPNYWSRALSELSKQDPVLRALIRRNRKQVLQGRSDAFVTLARSIVGQQISVKAAASIWQRVLDAAGSIDAAPDNPANKVSVRNERATKPGPSVVNSIHPGSIYPGAIVRMSVEQLRGCGLSGRKSTYLSELASYFFENSPNSETWRGLDDEQLIEELTKLKGIGRWTAEMFLMFYMMRPNVLPLDDVGLQRAMQTLYSEGEPLSKPEMRKIAENWAPWCTVATWFMWRSLDVQPIR